MHLRVRLRIKAFRQQIIRILQPQRLFCMKLLAVIILKSFATSATFGAGGIGGIFAPTLFIGVNTGLFLAEILKYFGAVQVWGWRN